MLKLRGTYCAALTPLTEDFTINKKLFLDHCYNLLSQDLDGLAIFGTTGEANSFNVNEKIDVMNYLVENNINPEKLLPGTGQCSVKDTVLLSKSIANLNVKSINSLIVFPYPVPILYASDFNFSLLVALIKKALQISSIYI